jgi:hypothetical protein
MRKPVLYCALALAIALPWTSTASAAISAAVSGKPAKIEPIAVQAAASSTSPAAVDAAVAAPSATTASSSAKAPVAQSATYSAAHVTGFALPAIATGRRYPGTGVSFTAGALRVARGHVWNPPAPAPAPAPVPAPATNRWIGFYESGTPTSITPLLTLESQIAAKSAVVNFYVADSETFPVNRVATIASHGSIPMVTWEFWSTKTGGVATISNGSKDAYLRAFADSAKAYGHEIWIRPLHEMNSTWYPWAGGTAGNSAASVVAAWKHIKQVFIDRGATNVKLVWSPNNDSVPNTTANAIAAYWPGDAYVDILAIDGYNFGTSLGGSWRPFSSVIGSSYSTVTKLSAKPLILAETGCVEQGGSKSAWITNMFSVIKSSYPRITGVCWFNVNDTAKSTDFRVESTSSSLAAFKAAMVAGY